MLLGKERERKRERKNVNVCATARQFHPLIFTPHVDTMTESTQTTVGEFVQR